MHDRLLSLSEEGGLRDASAVDKRVATLETA